MVVTFVVLFYLLYALEDQNTTHIRLLSRVSGSLADEEIVGKLLMEDSPQKIIDLLNAEGVSA